MIFNCLICVLGCTLKIETSNNCKGLLELSGCETTRLYFVSFHDNVVPQIKERNFRMFTSCHKRKWFVLRATDSTITIKYLKTLSKSFMYDYNLDIGTKIFVMSYENGKFMDYREVYDWCAIPDLSMAFISYSLCGIVLSFVFKIYLD